MERTSTDASPSAHMYTVALAVVSRARLCTQRKRALCGTAVVVASAGRNPRASTTTRELGAPPNAKDASSFSYDSREPSLSRRQAVCYSEGPLFALVGGP